MANEDRDWVRLEEPGPPVAMAADRRDDGGLRRKLALGVGALVVVVIAGGLWLTSGEEESEGPPPLVQADGGPVKHRPEDPGGMEVPNQDMLVYQRVSPNPSLPRAERLLPPPEQPIDRPDPPPAETADAGGTAVPDAANRMPPADPAAPAPAADRSVTAEALPGNAPAAEGQVAEQPNIQAAEAQRPEPAEEQAGEAVASDEADAAPAAGLPRPAQKPAMAVLAAKATASPPPAPAAAPPASADKASAPGPLLVTAAAAPDNYRIQLASFSDEAGANTAWRKLVGAHAAILGKLKPIVVRVDLGQGVRYRLQAGSFADADDAREACSELKTRKQDCLVVSPS